jgi:prepilin-type N-terminal cleavage/methylation domain-containing protein
MRRLMGRGRRHGRDQAGVTLIELTIAMALLAITVVAVDSSLTVVVEHQVQMTNQTEALDNLQGAQEAMTRDILGATAWTTPAVPTTAPSTPVTAQTLVFQASLSGITNLITISLNTTTHQLQMCSNLTLTTSGCGSSVAGVRLQSQVANIDSASLFTFTTHEVTQTINSLTTNTFFYTSVASVLTLDSPAVGAPRVSQTTVQTPAIVIYNMAYSCQTASSNEGASGTC